MCTCERRAWERGAREPAALAELAELAFLQSKPCASTSCWFARCWASAARGCRGRASHRRGARGGRRGRPRQQGQGCARAASAARSAACLLLRRLASRDQVWGCHVTPASFRYFSWSLHPCCLAPLHPSPRPPFLSPLVAPTPTTPAVPPLPSQGSPASPSLSRTRLTGHCEVCAMGRGEYFCDFASTRRGGSRSPACTPLPSSCAPRPARSFHVGARQRSALR